MDFMGAWEGISCKGFDSVSYANGGFLLPRPRTAPEVGESSAVHALKVFHAALSEAKEEPSPDVLSGIPILDLSLGLQEWKLGRHRGDVLLDSLPLDDSEGTSIHKMSTTYDDLGLFPSMLQLRQVVKMQLLKIYLIYCQTLAISRSMRQC